MSEHDELLKELDVAVAAATFQNLSIIGALAECHLVDQANIADWAEFFASELQKGGNGRRPAKLEHGRKVAARLRDYAGSTVLFKSDWWLKPISGQPPLTLFKRCPSW